MQITTIFFSVQVCWHCGLPSDKPWHNIYPKSGSGTTNSNDIQYTLHELYGSHYIQANACKSDQVCSDCRNAIVSFTRCHKRLTDIKNGIVSKGHHLRSDKRSLPATPSLSPAKQPMKKLKKIPKTKLQSPLVQVCLQFNVYIAKRHISSPTFSLWRLMIFFCLFRLPGKKSHAEGSTIPFNIEICKHALCVDIWHPYDGNFNLSFTWKIDPWPPYCLKEKFCRNIFKDSRI